MAATKKTATARSRSAPTGSAAKRAAIVLLALILTHLPAATAQGLIAGTGQTKSAVFDESLVPAMAAEVVAEVRAAYGPGQPKVVLLINNAGAIPTVIAAIRDEFGDTVPIGGAGTASDHYNSFTAEEFVDHQQRSLAILALGGDGLDAVFMAQDDSIGYGADKELVQQCGRKVGLQLMPHVDPAKENVLLLFGPGHVPNISYVLDGVKEAVGNPVPSHLKILGWASANNGGSVANGVYTIRSVTGVLLQGDFALSLRGVGEHFGGDPVAVSTDLLSEVTNELGGLPQVLFYVPGHPDVDGATFEDMRVATVPFLAPGGALFGHVAGGEAGHLTTAAQPLAGSYHWFVAGLRSIETGGDSLFSDGFETGSTSAWSVAP
jgi:hypothetical protein